MKQRKRILALLPAAALVLGLLAGCQQPDPAVSGGEEEFAPSCLALLTAVWGGELPAGENRELYDGSDPETLNTYIQGAYGLTEGEWADAAVARETGMSARETGVLRFADEDAARHGEEALQDYLRTREGDFTGYAPEQAALAADGIVCREGSYVGLFIHEGAADLRSAFLTALETGELPEPPAPSAAAIHDAAPEELVNEIWYALYAAGCAERPIELSNPLEYRAGVSKQDWKKVFSLTGLGGEPMDLTVVRCKDEDAAARVEEALRANSLFVTEDTPASTAVCRLGQYVGEFVCQNSVLAEETFRRLLEDGFEPRELAAVTAQPAFELSDLLFRLLLEGGACPDWETMPFKARSDTRGFSSQFTTWMFGPMPDQYEDFSCSYWDTEGTGTSYDEAPNALALFQTAGEEEAKALLPALRAAVERRREAAQKELDYYASEGFDLQARLEYWPEFDLEGTVDGLTRLLAGLESAQAVQCGRYAALLMCDDPAAVVTALPRFIASPDTAGYFSRYLERVQANRPADPVTPDPNYPDRELYTPPNDEDMTIYDTSAILAAWAQKDPAGLSEYDRDIYDAAQALLAKLIKDGMTELEKETAVYTWLVNNVDYDSSHMDVMEETSRDAYGPYGGLVDRSAVCLGYATTFQLLMDMAGVECVTVVGAGSHSTAAHAWNVVKPDGNWYCVDVTWDANGREQLGSGYEWRYFNITSDQMAKNHQWDYANVPEAVTAP